jgi:hypothetical protein
MASFRTVLEKGNMDLVMYFVRTLDCNPSEAMNYLLNNPHMITIARSLLYAETVGRENRSKKQQI